MVGQEAQLDNLGNINIMPLVDPRVTLSTCGSLLERFGVIIDPVSDPDQFILAVDQMDPRYKGKESAERLVRFQLEEDKTLWPEDAIRIFEGTAVDLDMVTASELALAKECRDGTIDKASLKDLGAVDEFRKDGLISSKTELIGKFSTVIALGGARLAPRDRALFTADALMANQAQGQLVIAGSDRMLNDDEKAFIRDVIPNPLYEYQLCLNALSAVVEKYPDLAPQMVRVPNPKAITDNVIEAVISRVGLGKGDSMAGVTTQIYRTFTAHDFSRVGRQYGIQTNVAGNPSDLTIVVNRTPATYFSEILRTMRAATLDLAS